MTERTLFEQGSTVLDSSGSGTVILRPSGESWTITHTSVSARIPNVAPVLESSCLVYRNYVGPAYLIDNTVSGSSGDTSDTTHELSDGDSLIFVWTGGDVGATANVTIRGIGSGFSSGGFRAV